MIRLKMIREDFLNSIRSKLVHVDFFNQQKGTITWIEGFFDYEIVGDDEAENCEDFVDITTDTDFVRIPMKDVRKIYLKEDNVEGIKKQVESAKKIMSHACDHKE